MLGKRCELQLKNPCCSFRVQRQRRGVIRSNFDPGPPEEPDALLSGDSASDEHRGCPAKRRVRRPRGTFHARHVGSKSCSSSAGARAAAQCRDGLSNWPDIRPMVDNLIALDPDNAGAAVLDIFGCGIVNLFCTPAIWQQRPTSNFIRTLNAGAMTYPNVKLHGHLCEPEQLHPPEHERESQRFARRAERDEHRNQDFCGGLASVRRPRDRRRQSGCDGDDLECSRTARKAAQSPDRESPDMWPDRIGTGESPGPLVQNYFTTFTQTIPNTVGCRLSLRFAATRPGPGCKR